MMVVKRVLMLMILMMAAWAKADTKNTLRTDNLIKPLPATQTARWLQLQREGGAASKHIQTSTVLEKELSSQRWLNSYQHAIPDLYEQGIEGKTRN